MAILIAHRGLIDGPNDVQENHPTTLLQARQLGYDVEIDLWFADGRWMLGHDQPQYEVDLDWLHSIDQKDYLDSHHAWIHAKSIQTLYELRRLRWEGHMFFHDSDQAVITSTGYIWTHCSVDILTPLSICVLPERIISLEKTLTVDVYGVCTDYVTKLQQMRLW